MIVTLQGCVYRMDVPQGNAVEPDKLAQIKPGMTRKQVEFLIGQPAIQDPFHANEDYYIYYLYHGKTGRVVEFYDEVIEKRQKEIARKYGFTITEHTMILYGHFDEDLSEESSS